MEQRIGFRYEWLYCLACLTSIHPPRHRLWFHFELNFKQKKMYQVWDLLWCQQMRSNIQKIPEHNNGHIFIIVGIPHISSIISIYDSKRWTATTQCREQHACNFLWISTSPNEMNRKCIWYEDSKMVWEKCFSWMRYQLTGSKNWRSILSRDQEFRQRDNQKLSW